AGKAVRVPTPRDTATPIVLRGHRGLITHVAFSHDGKTVYSSSSDGSLRRWDVATGAGATVIEGITPVRGFAIARDGRIAATAGGSRAAWSIVRSACGAPRPGRCSMSCAATATS